MKILLGGIAILLWGLFMFLAPGTFWELTESWKNSAGSAPSGAYLLSIRAGGVVCMVMGAVVLFFFLL